MVIFRTKPAIIKYQDTLIFPGAQFMHDQMFDYLVNKYSDFVNETKGGRRAAIQVLIEPAKPVIVDDPDFKPDPKNKELKASKVKTWPNSKKNIGDELKAITEEKAVEIVQEIIDEQELRDVQAMDTRREVQAACVKQWEERGAAMTRLASMATAKASQDVARKPIYSTDDPIVKEVVNDMAASR